MQRDAVFTVEGDTVRGTLHLPDGTPRGALVFNHGLASDVREFGDAPAALAKRGWAVLVFDRRGHGASEGERGLVTGAGAIMDLRAAVAWLRTAPETRDARLGVVGHSLGAAFTLLALPQMPEFETACLVAPLARVRDEIGLLEFQGYRAAYRASKLKERMGLGPLVVPYKNRYTRLFTDPEAAKRAESLGFLQDRISLANYDELMAVDAPAWALNVTQPTLVVLARHDKAVQNKSSLRVFDALAGPKELVALECGHSAFIDARREDLVDHLDRWFAARLESGESE